MWIYGPTFNFSCYSLILMISLKLLNSHIPISRALIMCSRGCYYLDGHTHSANTRLFSPHSSEFYTFSGFFFLLPSVCVSYDKTSLLRRYEILEQEFSNCGVRKNHLGDMFNMQMPGPHASGHPGSQSGWSPGICTLPLFLGILMQVVPGHRGEMEVPRGESSHSKPCSRATTHISGPVVRIKWDNRWERALESIQHSINTRRHYYFQAGTALWQKWLGTFSLNYHNHLFEAPTKLITLSAAGMEEIPPETSSKKKNSFDVRMCLGPCLVLCQKLPAFSVTGPIFSGADQHLLQPGGPWL